MEYRRLGDSDLHVSEISLGSWLTYGGGVERASGITLSEDTLRAVDAALGDVVVR